MFEYDLKLNNFILDSDEKNMGASRSQKNMDKEQFTVDKSICHEFRDVIITTK